MRHLRSLVALASTVALLAACGSSPGEDACEAFVDAFSKRAVDGCALGTPASIRASILASFGTLGVDECSDFTRVRDEISFYDECLPALEVLECSAFAAGPLPTSCNMQLLVVR
jgi:hypothetical protein